MSAEPRRLPTATELRADTARRAERKLEEFQLALGEAIDKVMQQKGLTAVDLAILGPSENTVNAVRRGTNNTMVSTMILVLTALECEIRFEVVPIDQSLPKDWKA